MKKFLNTLFVTQPDVYMGLDEENVSLQKEKQKLAKMPLHNLESIVAFGYTGASPALMGYCADKNISIVFMTMTGRYLARVVGESRGNVVLRKKQYRISDSNLESAMAARNFLIGKVYNNKWVIERTIRDHPMRINEEELKAVSDNLSNIILESFSKYPARTWTTIQESIQPHQVKLGKKVNDLNRLIECCFKDRY